MGREISNMKGFIRRISVSSLLLQCLLTSSFTTCCNLHNPLYFSSFHLHGFHAHPDLQSPLSEAGPVVEWGPCHIDLGREVSMMHSTLSSQLKSIQLIEVSSNSSSWAWRGVGVGAKVQWNPLMWTPLGPTNMF